MHEIETVGYCYRMLKDMFNVQAGDNVAITYDTESCEELALATAQAAYMLGGKPLLLKNALTRGPGREGDPDLPLEMLIGCLSKADVWVEYNKHNIYSSTVFNTVEKNNKKCRYLLLLGMDTGGMKRLIGSVNMPALTELTKKVTDLTIKAKHMRITSPMGTDIEFDNVADRPVSVEDGIILPGEYKMVPGQISWTPDFDSINGKIVGELSMIPSPALDAPVTLTIEKGYITKIEGGSSAAEIDAYFKAFNDPDMYRMAHVSYGFNPGAKPGHGVVEDERIWGGVCFGFGNIDPTLIKGSQLDKDNPDGLHCDGHTDAMCTQTTITLDGKLIFKDGELVGPTEEIREMGKKCFA
mgnify:CR=1 FL=1